LGGVAVARATVFDSSAAVLRVSEGAGATAKATAFARGDLDSDGNVATYSITVTPDADYHAQVAAIAKEDPDE
jgi:hypothetical protein